MCSDSGRRLLRAVVCLFLLTLPVLAGCGKQGPPAPPLRAVPAKTTDLRVRQQGTRVLLELTYPQTTPAGQVLGGLTAVEVLEAVQAAPREGKPAPLDARAFQAAAQTRVRIAGPDLANATFGNKVVIPLPAPESTEAAPATPQATPQARYYAVRTVGPQGDASELSNQVALVPGPTPPAPERVTAAGRPDGVLVEWSPVEGAAGGYNIYRRGAQERSVGQPVHSAPATEQSWLDTGARLGQSYIYSVTAIASPDPLVESAVASEQEVRYQDRFAPPPPLELVALAEGGRVRLIWQGTEAEDLAGYHVYRRGAAGDFVRLTQQPLQTTEYADPDVVPGQSYSYRVTAVDQVGNESGPGAEVRAAVP